MRGINNVKNVSFDFENIALAPCGACGCVDVKPFDGDPLLYADGDRLNSIECQRCGNRAGSVSVDEWAKQQALKRFNRFEALLGVMAAAGCDRGESIRRAVEAMDDAEAHAGKAMGGGESA